MTVDCSDNMTVILKKLFAKDLLIKYTAQKPKAAKFVFKDTSFYTKLEGKHVLKTKSTIPLKMVIK